MAINLGRACDKLAACDQFVTNARPLVASSSSSCGQFAAACEQLVTSDVLNISLRQRRFVIRDMCTCEARAPVPDVARIRCDAARGFRHLAKIPHDVVGVPRAHAATVLRRLAPAVGGREQRACLIMAMQRSQSPGRSPRLEMAGGSEPGLGLSTWPGAVRRRGCCAQHLRARAKLRTARACLSERARE